jgi:predicted ester cyclase
MPAQSSAIPYLLRMQKQMVRQWYEQMWNRWDESVFEQILDPEVKLRGSLGPSHQGFEGISNYMRFVRAAFPDFHNRIDLMVEEGNQVFARLTYSGTHEGELFRIPPTGSKIEYAGAALFTFERGRIAEVWVLGDIDHLKRQLSEV